jgi:hypothetical protein
LARILTLLIVALAGAYVLLVRGPFSLRAEYDADVATLAAVPATMPIVTDADLSALPVQVQRYLRLAGVVGQPRVASFRARMHGRIRSGPDDRWMSFTAEQVNTVRARARMFYLTAWMSGVPVQGYHRYIGADATMRIRAAALIPIVNAAGPRMTQSETVTLLNDLFMFAPAALIDSGITWQDIDAHTVSATLSNAGHLVRARITFGDDGNFADFMSDDRYQASRDGTQQTLLPWSTPVAGYRWFGAVQLPSGGEGRWHAPGGAYPYIELAVDDVAYNVRD